MTSFHFPPELANPRRPPRSIRSASASEICTLPLPHPQAREEIITSETCRAPKHSKIIRLLALVPRLRTLSLKLQAQTLHPLRFQSPLQILHHAHPVKRRLSNPRYSFAKQRVQNYMKNCRAKPILTRCAGIHGLVLSQVPSGCAP